MIIEKSLLCKIAIELNKNMKVEPPIDLTLDIINMQAAIHKVISLTTEKDDKWISDDLFLYIYYKTKEVFNRGCNLSERMSVNRVNEIKNKRKKEREERAKNNGKKAQKITVEVQMIIDLLNENLYSDNEIVSIVQCDFPEYSTEKIIKKIKQIKENK